MKIKKWERGFITGLIIGTIIWLTVNILILKSISDKMEETTKVSNEILERSYQRLLKSN